MDKKKDFSKSNWNKHISPGVYNGMGGGNMKLGREKGGKCKRNRGKGTEKGRKRENKK
jgi:hypothetical protein